MAVMQLLSVFSMVVQAHRIDIEELKEQVLQKDAASEIMNADKQQLQQQVADKDSHLVSLTADLATAKETYNCLLQVSCAASAEC